MVNWMSARRFVTIEYEDELYVLDVYTAEGYYDPDVDVEKLVGSAMSPKEITEKLNEFFEKRNLYLKECNRLGEEIIKLQKELKKKEDLNE